MENTQSPTPPMSNHGKKKNSGCMKAFIILSIMIVFIVGLFSLIGRPKERKIDPRIVQLKKEHCDIEWSKIDKRTKEKLLNEYIEHDVDLTDSNVLASPFTLSEKLLNQAVKYPATIKKDGLPIGKIEDIEKGIIEFQQPFTSENKLGMTVKGHYWLKMQYNAGCKPAKIIDFIVE